MKSRFFKFVTLLLALVAILSAVAGPASALEWSGDANGTGGTASGIANNGFALADMKDNLAGYRFSVVDKNGNTRNGKVIDVFRDTEYGRYSYNLSYSNWGHKFIPKYNKVQWIKYQNTGYRTGHTAANTYLEGSDIIFQSDMPITTKIEDWVKKTPNLNAILGKLGIANHNALNPGDRVLVEPLYYIRVNKYWHTMTVTEIGVLGKSKWGGSSVGGYSTEPGTWSWIKKYANRIFPCSLYEPTGADGLWTPATYFSSGAANFNTLINSGYGVGIAYSIEKTATYKVVYKGNGSTSGSTPTSIHEIDVASRLSANGFTRENYIFKGWNTKKNGSGDSYSDRQSVINLTTEKDGVVTLYAQWEVDPVLSIRAIEPNASYKEGVSVVTAFRVYNETDDRNFTPSNKVTVKFKVYKGSKVIYSATKKNVPIPADESNLVYFKWDVPSGVSGKNLKVTGEVLLNTLSVDKDSMTVRGARVSEYQTPDTQYEAKRPEDWSKPSTPGKLIKTATWSEWVYSGGRFVKKTYKLTLSSTLKISADPDSPSGSSSALKSGYGFTLDWDVEVKSTGTYTATSDMYTQVQTAYARFPEFKYASTSGKTRLLELIDGSFSFYENRAADGDRIHFTPLWYPNGNYIVCGYGTDCWTPAGMIYIQDISNALTIQGDLYDDYFIGRH